METDPAKLVAESQLVVTTTPSREPVLKAEWLHPGLHATAMGSDQPGKVEIDPACFAKLSAYVPDRLSQTRIQGELRAAIAAGTTAADRAFAELGDIVAGKAPGRTGAGDITLADLTGTGAQDTAIATHAVALAAGAGAGTAFSA